MLADSIHPTVAWGAVTAPLMEIIKTCMPVLPAAGGNGRLVYQRAYMRRFQAAYRTVRCGPPCSRQLIRSSSDHTHAVTATDEK